MTDPLAGLTVRDVCSLASYLLVRLARERGEMPSETSVEMAADAPGDMLKTLLLSLGKSFEERDC